MLTIGSLFSGIGGLELGLEQAGLGPVLWQVEKDALCTRVLARHWPDVQRYPDVKDVGANLAPVDIVCGGFPCQPVSYAGKLKAQADERWFWPEFARILEHVRPRAVVIENVPGLLWRGLDFIVRDLDSLGFAMEATRLGARDVGAPHRRERLFVLGTRAPLADAHGQRQLCQQGSGHEGALWPGHGRRTLDAWPPEPPVDRVAHGLPRRVDRMRMLGNAVVPPCAYVVGMRLRERLGLLP